MSSWPWFENYLFPTRRTWSPSVSSGSCTRRYWTSPPAPWQGNFNHTVFPSLNSPLQLDYLLLKAIHFSMQDSCLCWALQSLGWCLDPSPPPHPHFCAFCGACSHHVLPRFTLVQGDVCSCFIDVELFFLFQCKDHFPLDAQRRRTEIFYY